jgi:hypothetical protein
MYFRYLATDAGGSYALLSHAPLTPPESGEVDLRLLETTEDYAAAIKAHRDLEERLRQRRSRGSLRRGPTP